MFLMQRFVPDPKRDMTIEVFKTNVANETEANELKRVLHLHFPGSRVNFDLHDCDRVLRIEGADFTADQVVILAEAKGVVCSLLD
jgi:hypothetical protein